MTDTSPSPSSLTVASALFTAVISDVLDARGLRNQVADPRIRPLSTEMRFFGRAKTFKVEAVDGPPPEPYSHLIRGIAAAETGDVLVADLGGRTSSGFFGGLLATACQISGVAAAVVDGAVRDYAELFKLGFPTFCTAFNPADSFGRDEAVACDVPIQIGGVPVSPGDYLFGDADGVVIIPAHEVEPVLVAAREKVQREGGMREALIAGMPIDEAFRRFKVL